MAQELLEWYRQVHGLSAIHRYACGIVWWTPALGSMAEYWSDIGRHFQMLSPAQQERLRPLLDATFAQHAADRGRTLAGMLGGVGRHRRRARRAQRDARSQLATAVRRSHARVRSLVGRVPPSAEKALDCLRAYTEGCEQHACEGLAEAAELDDWRVDVSSLKKLLADSLKLSYQAHLSRHERIPTIADAGDGEAREPSGTSLVFRPAEATHVFWTSFDYHEEADCLRFLRFVEHFRGQGFDGAVASARQSVTQLMLEAMRPRRPLLPLPFGDSEALRPGSALGIRFWPLGDLPETAALLRPAISLATDIVASSAHPDGFWIHPDWPRGPVDWSSGVTGILPNERNTAACTLFLWQFAQSPGTSEVARGSTQWLLAQQHPDGFWRDRVREVEGRGEYVPSLGATCLAGKALLRQSQVDPGDAIDRAAHWVLGEQDRFGLWPGSGGEPANDTTLLALSFLREARIPWRRTSQKPTYLQCSLRLAAGGLESGAHDDAGGLQVAVLLLYHAVELFLYSVLTLPTVNQRIREDGQTIGFPKALTRFEEHLRQSKALKPGERVRNRDALDTLSHVRGEIAHKGIGVTAADAQPLLDAACDLIQTWCPHFHGIPAQLRA